MIYWILTKMEQNPNAAFSWKELAQRFPEQSQEASVKKLLCRVETSVDGNYYHFGLNDPYLVVEDQEGLEAINEDELESDPIPLALEDLVCYKLDLEAFAKNVQQESQLAGKPASLTDRLLFLGELETDGILTAYVLALINESPGMDEILLGLPSLLPAEYRRILVVCPSHMPAPTYRRQLGDLAIRVALLPEDKPLVLPPLDTSWQDLIRMRPNFLHSADYDSITWNGQSYGLTPEQAAVVRILHRGHRAGAPDLSWDQIKQGLNSIQMYPLKMSDIFRGSPLWNTLVIRSRKGMYRLDI